MKLFIASDIHGSFEYAKLMIQRFNESRADKLVLLGDLLYHGPRNNLPFEYNPDKVANLLNEYKDKIICVRGNCDAEVDQMILDFPIMSDYCLINIDNHNFYFTHGHINNKIKLTSEDYLINGHTHIYVLDKHYINVGSISIPKGDTVNSYVIYENDTFSLYNLISNEFIEKMEIKKN